jgi:hypothetical protein
MKEKISEARIDELKHKIKSLRVWSEKDHKKLEEVLKDVLNFSEKYNCMVYSITSREQAYLENQTELLSKVASIQSYMQNIINKTIEIDTIAELIYAFECDEVEIEEGEEIK